MLSVSHLRLHLLPDSELQLPAYNKGNSLRGGFGSAFRRLVCVDLRWQCAECSLRYTCPYTKVFNPFIPPDAVQFTGNQNIPRPFVFKPPLTAQTRYAPGEPLVFDLVVIGEAVDYLPYFIAAFRELGTTGFGLNRAHVQLARVESIATDGAATAVYEASNNTVRPAPAMALEVAGSRSSVSGKENDDRSPATADRLPTADYVCLDFLTPTSLKSGSTANQPGAIVRRPAFHLILKRLRDRVNALATFYGGGPLALDFKALGEAAERVETVFDRTRWVERARASRRPSGPTTDYRRPATVLPHDLSGFVGRITFRGDLAPFLPLLRIGEYVHVGKNAVFGNGWFVMKSAVDGQR